MTTVTVEGRRPGGFRRALLSRQLAHYPDTKARYGYLAIVVVTTIVLYYLYYVEGAITPLLLPALHMSFRYFLYLLVVSNAIGAFTAFIGGLSDRIGRANLTIFGTLAVGLLQLVAIPNVHSKLAFSVAYCVIGFVEGIILVSTPALIRDFSPQMGRAAAMGFWALGPTIGSLVASEVATRTLPHLPPWQDQFIISGFVCLGVVALSLVGLRELAPELRDQLMVSEHERALVEARARGLDVEAATAHPLRSMLNLELLSASVGISLFLLIYYASVSVLTLYWVVVFNRTTADANGINTWYWAFDAAALVLIGTLSDRLRVRKPFMLLGTLGAMAVTVVFIVQAGHPHAGYYANVLVVMGLGLAIGCSYSPWMAAYTERVEARNPALTATGLAIWGWALRIIVAISFVVLPRVITTSTTLVDNQTQAAALQTIQAASPYAPPTSPGAPQPKAPPASVLASLRQIGPPGQALAGVITAYDQSHNLLGALGSLPPALQKQAVALVSFEPLALRIQHGQAVTDAEIASVGQNSPQLASLLQAEKTLVPAQNASAAQWKHWWWVCFGGQLVFLIIIFTMKGHWSPRAARYDFVEHERAVQHELALLRGEGPAPAAPVGAGT